MNIHTMTKSLFLAVGFMTVGLSSQVFAVCTTLVNGPVAIQVKQCSLVSPETSFKGDIKYNFIRDLPPANRKQFLGTYKGSLIEGTVAQSQAVRSGISDEKGALLNEKISAFIPLAGGSCGTILGKLIEVELKQTCCDGGGASPCLLNTGYALSAVKVSDGKSSSNSPGIKKSAEGQAIYAKAKTAAAAKDYKTAVVLFEKLRSKGELDALGQFQLGLIYRELDKCSNALPILEPLHQRFEKKDFWTDTEAPIRKGTFLYARCLSVLGRASESTLVLQGFLVERQRYRKEIKDSLFHRDFGAIKSSKSWQSYKKAADKALSAPPDAEDDDPIASPETF